MQVLGVPAGGAIATAWAVVAAAAKHRASDMKSWALAAGFGLAAAIAPRLARTRAGMAAAVACVLAVVLALVVAGSGMLAVAVRLRCTALEIGSAALPLAATAFLLRGPAHPAVYAAVAACGALAGEAALHLCCSARMQLPHLLVFHAGGVLLAAGLGAAFGAMRRGSALPR